MTITSFTQHEPKAVNISFIDPKIFSSIGTSIGTSGHLGLCHFSGDVVPGSAVITSVVFMELSLHGLSLAIPVFFEVSGMLRSAIQSQDLNSW